MNEPNDRTEALTYPLALSLHGRQARERRLGPARGMSRKAKKGKKGAWHL